MNKKLVFLLPLFILFIGCGSSTDKPAAESKPDTTPAKVSEKRKVIVSDDIKKLWSEAKIFVKDKINGNNKIYTVPLHSNFEVPNSDLLVEVGAFIPDFYMGKESIESKSKELNNPALQVTVKDNGKTLYTGWLFSKFPDMHVFEHPRYSLSLAEEMFEK